ncbi:hypothetical protein F4825DRAFT_285404 [Nemania diffusa]|nr:hypothetical protein F4825DRAFT_285404 [Nemania diffusa]
MPYLDNMYSMSDDSDGEDYTNHLSPSDGQFPASSSHVTPRIPNIFIPDPTLQQGTGGAAKSKAQEADEDKFLDTQKYPGCRSSEPSFSSSQPGQAAATTSTSLARHHQQVTYSQSSASQGPQRGSQSRAWSPSLYSEAPPAYSPSAISPIASRSTGSQQDRPRNYNTFGIHRIMGAQEVESERLLGSHPESMGGPVDEESGRRAWVRRARRRVPGWFNWKYALLAFAVLIVSVLFLSGISSGSSSHHHNKGDDATPNPSLPVEKEPEVPDDSEVPGDSQTPNGPESPETPYKPTYCEGQQHRYNDQMLSLEFVRSQNLTFKENGYRHPGSTSVRVGGQVNVRRLNKGDGEPRIVLDIVTNEPDLRLYTSLDASLQEMKVTVPETYESTVRGQRPCVEIKGTVWVPADGEIGVLSLRANHLDILLLDDLSLHVADYTEIASVVGHIRAAAAIEEEGASLPNPDYTFVPAKDSWALDSRIIEVRTTAGRIDGNWPLYDMLGLHTTSGSVAVSITPQAALATAPKPAVLSLSTISGAVSATEPIHAPGEEIPPRAYLVDVRSTSGTVSGALAFGAALTAHATASSLGLDLLPVVVDVDALTPESPAQLETITTSGAIAVRVLEPVFYDGQGKVLAGAKAKVLDCLEATHKSTSGSIGLRYPQSWEGTLYAHTTSGQLVAKGKDLKILKYTGGWPGSKMEARKGAEGKKSTIEVNALLGSMEAIVGDE